MFHSPIPACVFFNSENFRSYAEPPVCQPDAALRFTAAVWVLSRLLAQILFHCKMMPISKAGRPAAVVWLLRHSGGESYLGRQLFSAHDVASNTSGSSRCFRREHINNFHWCTNEREGERESERESESLAEFTEFVCVCSDGGVSGRTAFREYSAEQVVRTCSSTCFMFRELPPTPIGFKPSTFSRRPTLVGGETPELRPQPRLRVNLDVSARSWRRGGAFLFRCFLSSAAARCRHEIGVKKSLHSAYASR